MKSSLLNFVKLMGQSVLPSITMSQQKAGPTTGKGHKNSSQATGYITFYNAAPSVQTVVAGTLITGSDGTQVVTDQDVNIPAVSYPTLGQANVSAHTTSVGPSGNIKAGDIYGPCCRLNVSAVNGTFSGGQNAYDYQMIT